MSGRTTAQRVVVLGAALAVTAAAGGGLPPLASVQAASGAGEAFAQAATEPVPLEHWDVERTTATPAELAAAALSEAPGQVAPAAFGTAANGVPERVLQAYLGAERLLAEQSPSCRLPWWLVAGIGAVESRHASGGRVDVNGRTRGLVLGPLLDGSLAGTAVITDSDGGALDGSSTFDRAVGPMQFLPGTWASYGADADGDGTADPHDVDDAAFSAGRYLCAGGGDLTRPEDLASAVLRYNRSTAYLEAVLGWGAAYRDGGVPVAGEPGDVEPAPAVTPAPPAARAVPAPTPLVRQPTTAPTTAPTPGPSPTGGTTTSSPSPSTSSPTTPPTGSSDPCTPDGTNPDGTPVEGGTGTGAPTDGGGTGTPDPTGPDPGAAAPAPISTAPGGPTDGSPTTGGTEAPAEQPAPGCATTPPGGGSPTGEPTSLPATTASRTGDPTATGDPTRSSTQDPTRSATSDPTQDPTRSATQDPTRSATQDPTQDAPTSRAATEEPTSSQTSTR